MLSFGRRHAVAANLSLVVVAGLLFATSGVAQASTARLTIVVRIGYHDAVKLSAWMPVTVDVTNNGSSLDGTLQVQPSNSFGGKGGPPTGSATYQMPISLGPGETKHLRTYVLEDQSGPVAVQVTQNGLVIGSQQANSTNTFAALVGILSDQSATLDSLATIHPGGIAPGIAHLAATDLPDSALVLRAFDLIAIDDFSTDTLTAAQRGALADYVAGGGSLLLGTGGSWHKTLAGLPTAILPMDVTGSVALGPSQVLGGASGVEVATGTLAGSRAWLNDGSWPLLVEKSVGSGIVAMSTFDWNQDSVAGWSGTQALLRQMFVRTTIGLNPSSAVFSGGGPAIAGSVSQQSGAFSQVLAELPALNLPAWWFIGSLVVLYVLLIGPINYFVLRALNRRALAWITVPTIAIVAAGGAYGASLLAKGRSVQVNQISVIYAEQGWDNAYLDAYTGLLAPTRGDYQVRVPGSDTLISPIAYNGGGGFADPNQGVIQVNTATGELTLPGMVAFSLRGFVTEGMTQAPKLVGHVELVNGKLTGTVQNLSSIPFTDAVLIAGNSYQKFGRLAPGASATFDVTPSVTNPNNGMPAIYQIYPSGLFGPPPAGNTTEVQRQNDSKAAVLSTLPTNGFKGMSLSVVPMFVAWSDQPSQNITVNGNAPHSYPETAVVLAMPVDQIGSGSLPAGVVAGRIVDLDGNVQPNGMPGMLAVQNGSATYDFAPALAPGAHLTAAALVSSNPYGGGFKGIPPGAGGAAGTVTSQVWDWSTSIWIDVNYQDSGSTSIPDSGVNPSTGEVLLKLGGDNGFSSGWLSLAGTIK
jgi:hypothetical protein